MKKWKIIIPSLMAIFGMPLISLTGCQNSNPSSTLPTFSVDNVTTLSATTASFELDWEPSDHSVAINDGTAVFKFGGNKEADVEIESSAGDRPINVKLTFNSGDLDEDITDGVLDFHFRDRTAQVTDAQQMVSNIYIECFDPSARQNFNTVPWDFLNDACIQLENEDITETQFCEKFYIENDSGDREDVTSLDQLIGQKRKIKLKTGINKTGQNDMSANIVHEVIVLDYQKDTIHSEGGDKDKQAALTFQFNNVLTGVGRKDEQCLFAIEWFDGESDWSNGDYWNSRLYKALNGTDTDTVVWKYYYGQDWFEVTNDFQRKSIFQLIDKQDLPEGAIKQVDKTVNVNQDPELSNITWAGDERPTYLFEPTIANVFSGQGMEDESTESYVSLHKDVYLNEGSQYRYYHNLIGDSAVSTQDEYSALKREVVTKGGQEVVCGNYWLSSPVTYSPTAPDQEEWQYAWSVTESSSIYSELKCNDGLASVAPCFCI